MPMNLNKSIFIRFLGFGLINNILYVVILSAAVDLVGNQTPKAVVLLADILPSFLFKLAAPFYIHLIPYKLRIWLLVCLSCCGMLIISLINSINLKIMGVCLASLSSGLGEVTFLQLTHYYDELYSIGGFSTGTGVAGIGGSFIFMLLTNILDLPTYLALLTFSIIPVGFIFLYYSLPSPDVVQYQQIRDESLRSEDDEEPHLGVIEPNRFKSHIIKTISQIKPLLIPFMIPLCSVYLCEYVINQGISPTLLFPLDTLPHWLFSTYRDMYVVYGFLYQLGVFISRSSITFGIKFRKLYVMSLLQFVNVVITLNQAVNFWPFTNIWVLCVLIFYEGLLGGLSYANTFVSVSETSSKINREFNMGCVGMSDSLGVVFAGLISYKLEPTLCRIQVSSGRDWCTKT